MKYLVILSDLPTNTAHLKKEGTKLIRSFSMPLPPSCVRIGNTQGVFWHLIFCQYYDADATALKRQKSWPFDDKLLVVAIYKVRKNDSLC
jgi:hypothetical protein